MKAEIVQSMGTDLTVVNAARVSFDKESEWEVLRYSVDEEHPVYGVVETIDVEKQLLSDKDKKLINYLAKHNHWTPFSHAAITIRETVPIFVARQRFKHMVGFTYNEVSRRYVDDTPEFYYPDVWRGRPEGSVKQGSSTEKLPEPEFLNGSCKNCGVDISPVLRTQGGGRTKVYCSDTCKYHYNNMNRNPYKAVWNNASARAKREGKVWDLDFDSFKFPTHCSILEIELDYSIGKGQIQDNSPSFDRIDPSKDYIEGNVRIISNKANTMKSNATPEELILFSKNTLRSEGMFIDPSLTYDTLIKKATALYTSMIEAGYAPEQARMVLPQSMYTSYYTTGSLSAWARAYNLRIDSHAQQEIRELAVQWDKIIRPLFPVSWEALTGAK